MLHPPLSLVLSWPVLNSVDPVTRNYARVILTACFIPIIILVVFLRIGTRWKITKSFGVDDTLIAFALIPTLAFDACLIAVDFHFYGRVHSWDTPLASDKANLKMYLATQLIFGASETPIKLSLICFYKRLLGSAASARFTCCIYASFFYIAVISVAYFVTTLLSCVPITASFDVFPTYHYTCVSSWMRVVFGFLHLAADVLLLILPIPIVWQLQMPKSQRLMVIGIFSLSVFACIAGLVRVYYTARVARSYDVGWEGYGEGMASILELNLGIICASAPALKPLVKRYWPGAMKTYETWELNEQNSQSRGRPFVEKRPGANSYSSKTSTEKILEEGSAQMYAWDAVGVPRGSGEEESSIGLALSEETLAR